nr:unnamed protein product [Digitaria exilis]CAB3503584.1 unnamed protein product [Digitaria exilis]
MAAMAPSSSSLSTRLPSKTVTPRRAGMLSSHKAPSAAAPRPLLLSFPAPARPRGAGLCAPAAKQDEYQFEEDDDGEDEEGYEGEEEWEEDDDDGEEEMDVEAMEEEARGAAADLAKRLARELHIDDDVREKRRNIRDRISISKQIPDSLLPKVAIIGRPNVGKSALFNRLVGGNRAIVVDEPGVTRDRLYGRSYWGDQEFMVIDTGGVITLSKSQAGVMEELAVTTTVGMDGIPLATREAAIARMPSMIEKQAVAAVGEATVVLFVVDGQAGLGDCLFVVFLGSISLIFKFINSLSIISSLSFILTNIMVQNIFQAGLVAADIEISDWLRCNYSDKCVILAVNKCESPRKGQMQALDFWTLGIISAAALVEKERSRRLGTSILNQVVREAIAFKPPPRTRGGKRGRVYYTTQAAVGPPTFVLFVNDAKLFSDMYRRYMEKKLRADAGFPGTPIRLLWRSRRRPDKRGEKNAYT